MSDMPQTSSQDANYMRAKVLGVSLFLIIFVAGIMYYFFLSRQGGGAQSEVQKEALDQAQVTTKTFAQEEYGKYISKVDSELVSIKGLTEETKDMLLYKKALVMIDALEQNEVKRDGLRVQAGGILKSLYEANSASRGIKQSVILAYILDYNQRFFLNGDTRLLPDVYRADYMKLYEASSTRAVSQKEFQQLAFKTYIRLANDPVASDLAHDKTFLSNRMYLTAAYLDGFSGAMTDEERTSLLASLKKDIDMYPASMNIAFTDPNHTKLVADFYYAYANDVYATYSTPKNVTSEAQRVQELYEKARRNVQPSGEPLETNLNLGQYIDTYYLAFLQASSAKFPKGKMLEVITEMSTYADNERSVATLKRFYTDFLDTRGSWMGVKRGLLGVHKTTEEYRTYLAKLGATLK